MPKIDFYVLNEASNEARLSFVCELVEKAYKNRHRIYLHAQDEKSAHHLDELLWTYRNDSFLPHNLVGDGPEPPPPIQIGYQTKPQNQRDILINLSETIPDFYKSFTRVIEIVNLNETIQNISRNHYRAYRADGFEITTHKLTVEA